MPIKKKALALLLTGGLVLSLAAFSACGNETPVTADAPVASAGEADEQPVMPSPEPTPEPPPEPTPEPMPEPTPESTPEPTPEPDIRPEDPEDKAIYGLRGNGYYNKTEFSQLEQEAIRFMLSNIVYEQENNREQAWDKMLFSIKQGDTMINIWPDGQVVHQKEGHNPRGYDCSNIDFDILIKILSSPQELDVEQTKTAEDMDSAVAAFRAHFEEFEQAGCAIDELWYEEYASLYYETAYYAQGDESFDTRNIAALFLRYTAGESGFYTAPEGETLLIYMTRESPDSPWKFESWFENPVTDRDKVE